MRRFFIGLVAASWLATPLAAQAPSAPASVAAPARVVIGFNPPLERPLRFRTTVTKTRSGSTTTVWTDYELGFTPRPEGYRLSVRATDAGSPGMTGAEAAMVRRTIVGLTLPYVLLLNSQGEIEGMEGEQEYWNRMLALTEQAIRQNVTTGGRTDEAALAQIMTMMRDLSPAARLAMATENIAPILQFAGANLTLGESQSGEAEIEGMLGMTLRQHSEIRAEGIENGRVHIVTRSTVPPEEMRRAIETVLARFPVTGEGHNNQAERDRGMARLRDARFDRQSEYRFEVSLDTGLVHAGGGEDRTVMMMDGTSHNQTDSYRVEQRD